MAAMKGNWQQVRSMGERLEAAVSELAAAAASEAGSSGEATAAATPAASESIFAKELEQLLRSWGQCGMLREEQ